ncbi:MAG: metallophosphoesterase family protein [Saccharolobus sp.]
MKLLILSDVHYPIGSKETALEIIKSVNPEQIIFLGDVVDNYNSTNSLLDLWDDFLEFLANNNSLEKSIFLYGDNDITDSTTKRNELKTISDFIKNKYKIELLRTYSIGNMFFFHGNIEKSHIAEKMGYYGVKVANLINKNIVPNILASNIIKTYGTEDKYNFFGHIHYLGKIENIKTTFCGTLNKNLQVFGNNSLGYVVINTENYNIPSFKNIEIMPL